MPPDTKPQSTVQLRPRSLKRLGCAATALFVVTMLIAAVGIGRSLWQSEPRYWVLNQRFLDQTPQAELSDMADRAFNRVLGELSRSSGYKPVDPTETPPSGSPGYGVRTIRLEFDEANAWLDQRLGDWLKNQGRQMPAGVSSPLISAHAGQLVAAIRYKSDEVDQVFSVFLTLTFTDDGQAMLHVQGVRGGRLPMPVSKVMDQLPGAGDNDDAGRSGVIAVLRGDRPFDPVLPIDGTRHARIIGLAVDDTGLMLTVRAEPNGEDD